MAHLIDKDALVAEIERRIAALKVECDRSKRPQFTLIGKISGLELCLSLINTLEVKEVDLEKEMSNFIDTYYKDAKIGYKLSIRRIAKHFFELGLKVNNIKEK